MNYTQYINVKYKEGSAKSTCYRRAEFPVRSYSPSGLEPSSTICVFIDPLTQLKHNANGTLTKSFTSFYRLNYLLKHSMSKC